MKAFFYAPKVKLNQSLLGLALIAVCVLFTAQSHAAKNSNEIEGVLRLDTKRSIPEFRLTDQNNESFSSKRLKGKVTVLDFIFTSCRGPCPLMTKRMAHLQRKFSKSDELQFVSISIDPLTDRPEKLKAYAKKYEADESKWHFLTSDKVETVHNLSQKGFWLPSETGDPDKSIDPAHSQRFVLINEKGEIVSFYDALENRALFQLEKDLEKILEGSES